MDYRVVTKWWNDHNYGVNFYIGQGPFKLGDSTKGTPWTEGNEIDRQLYFNDSIPNISGSAYFRSETFLDNPLGINDTLKKKFYKYPAIPPSSHHDAAKAFDVKIETVAYEVRKKKITLKWAADLPEEVRYYVIYKSDDTENPKNIVMITAQNSISVKRKSLGSGPYSFVITAVDRYRVESESVRLSSIN